MKTARGFTLVETMVALSIIGIISFAVVDFMSKASDETLYIEARSTQVQTQRNLMATASRLESIKRSMTHSGNAELERCMDSGPNQKPGNCTAIGEANKKPFTLYGRDDKPIAGPTSDPVLYDKRGTICKDGTPGCPFMSATANFWGSCPPVAKTGAPQSSCPQASSLVVHVELKPKSPTYLGRPMSKTDFRVSHRVFEEALGANQQCPPGAELKGIDPSGVVQCKCRTGFDQGPDSPDGSITCTGKGTLTCKEGELMNGRKADGTPLCIKATIVCDKPNSPTKFDDESATCKAGGWLENIDLGKCYPKSSGKKGADKNIECTKNQGKCCRYVY